MGFVVFDRGRRHVMPESFPVAAVQGGLHALPRRGEIHALGPSPSMEGGRGEARILVVEDDDALAAHLSDHLSADGFDVAVAASAGEALRALEVRRPELMVLDVVLPDAPGLAVLDRVRTADGLASRVDPDLPILVLSGRAAEADRVRGFARGADDYLVKPFAYSELLCRLRALLRRAGGRPRRGVLRVGDLTIDPASRDVHLAEERIELAAKEFALLQRLASDPTRVHLKNDLLRDVWGFASVGATRTLDAHACRLRRKLARSARPLVVNVRGVGYRLTEPG
jgi:DNA-binding response OmpR family regulator